MARVSYADRIARAIAKAAAEGRTITRQEARGHTAKEHIVRKERAAIRAAGGPLPPRRPVKSTHKPVYKSPYLTAAQRKAVRAYAREQAHRAIRQGEDVDPSDLADNAVAWAQRAGWERFELLRRETRQRERQYRGRRGEPRAKGMMEIWLGEMDYPDPQLLYYH